MSERLIDLVPKKSEAWTILDEFAARAMQALMTRPDEVLPTNSDMEEFASKAYEMAYAMCAERATG